MGGGSFFGKPLSFWCISEVVNTARAEWHMLPFLNLKRCEGWFFQEYRQDSFLHKKTEHRAAHKDRLAAFRAQLRSETRYACMEKLAQGNWTEILLGGNLQNKDLLRENFHREASPNQLAQGSLHREPAERTGRRRETHVDHAACLWGVALLSYAWDVLLVCAWY